MRKLVALAAAGAALAVATPAAAQYYPGGGYGYGGYGYGNGYTNWGQVRTLQRRIFNVLRSLGGVRYDQRESIRAEAINLDRGLNYAARNGLNPYEAHNFDMRIDRLERRMQWASMNRGYGRYGGYGYDRYNGYNDGYGYGYGYRHRGDDGEDNGDRDGD